MSILVTALRADCGWCRHCEKCGPVIYHAANEIEELEEKVSARETEIASLRRLLSACVQANDDGDYYNDTVWTKAASRLRAS